MNNPQVGNVYKTYIDAYHAAAKIRQQDIGVDKIVRIEKFPYGKGYVVRAEPVILDAFIPGVGMLGAFRGTRSVSPPGYSDKW